jgi:hypothetical protein
MMRVHSSNTGVVARYSKALMYSVQRRCVFGAFRKSTLCEQLVTRVKYALSCRVKRGGCLVVMGETNSGTRS